MADHPRKALSGGSVFRCACCGAAFLEARNDCCPVSFRGIINCEAPDPPFRAWNERSRAWGAVVDDFVFDANWMQGAFAPSGIGKFLPGAREASTTQAYESALRWSGIQRGVVLDFGCCLAHGSAVFQSRAPEVTYVGVDHESLFLAVASTVYSPDYLYLARRAEDFDAPLRHVADGSIDLLISSCLTNYDNCRQFLAEWLRVLKPGGILHLETHNPNAIKSASPRTEPYPVPADRQLIAAWLLEHFTPAAGNHALEDFVSGRTRMAGQFRLTRPRPADAEQ